MDRTLSKYLLTAALLLFVSGAASAALIGAQLDASSTESSVETPLHGKTIPVVPPGFARLALSDGGTVAGLAPGNAGYLNAVALSVPFEAYPVALVPSE